MSIMDEIQKSILVYRYNEETQKDAEKDYMDSYASFDRASYRLDDILHLKDYYPEYDFRFYALENLKNARHRLKSFLEDSRLNYNVTKDINLYDDIVVDYYTSIMDDKEDKYEKYYYIRHRQILLNLGLKHEIESAYEWMDKCNDYPDNNVKQYHILDEMMMLCKQLKGYDENE